MFEDYDERQRGRRRRQSRPKKEKEGRARRVKSKSIAKEDVGTSWRHSGGHQRRWSMVGLPMAVFLHNRFSGSPLLLSLSLSSFSRLQPFSSSLLRRSLSLLLAGPWSYRKKLLSGFFFGTAYISLANGIIYICIPKSVTCTRPRARAFSSRGVVS